jgi:O-antigen/teichoic acid export membrane protein
LEVLGLFVFASQFTLIFKTLIVFPIKSALNPIVFEMEDDPDSIRKFLLRSANYFCMVSFFVWLLISLFSKELVHVMGRNPTYWVAWPIVPVVTMSSVILGFNAYANKGIVMAKKTSLITFTYLFGCGANIALNFLFIPLWGAIGAAVATCAALVLFTGLNAYYSKRLYSLSFDLGKIARIALTAGALAVFGLMSNALGPVAAAALKLLLLASFPVLLFLTRAVSREELDACRETVLNNRPGRFLCTKLFRSGPMEG